MEIIGNIKVNGFLRVEDLGNGEIFAYLDDDEPLMFIYDNNCDYIINLKTNTITENKNIIFSERPIRKLKAKLIIED